MADNITVNTLSSDPVLATDDDGTAHHQLVKIEYGADNTQTPVSHANPLPIYDLFTAVSLGLVSGMSLVNKFGKAEDVNTGSFQTVWGGLSAEADHPDADYTFPSASFTAYVASSDNTDTQTIEIQGLDALGAAQTQTETLTGQTVVTVTGTWTAIHRVVVTGSTDIGGVLSVTTANNFTLGAPDNDNEIAALVSPGKNQTLMALYKVPTGKTAYLRRVYARSGKDDDFEVEFAVRPDGEVFQVKESGHIYQGGWEIRHELMPSYAADSWMCVRAKALTQTNKPITAGFDLLLVDD